MSTPRPDNSGGLDHWQVFMNIGRPVERRRITIPRSTIVLLILLGLAILLGLTGLGSAWGQTETVKKGRGGLGQIQITPLEKFKNSRDLSAATLYNFLQNFPGPVASTSPASALSPTIPNTATAPESPLTLLGVLSLLCLVVLWLHLRSTRGLR